MSAHGDERRGSKVIVVAEMADHNPELSCDKNIFRKKSEVKNKITADTNCQMEKEVSNNEKTKSTQELITSEEIESYDESCEKEEGCYWFEPSNQSEESLVEHEEILFQPEPYHGVREWL